MALNTSKTIRLDEKLFERVKSESNPSEFIRRVLYEYVNDPAQIEYEIAETKKDIERKEVELKDLKLKLKNKEHELEKLKLFAEERPDNYEETVDVLISIGHVSSKDFEYQAKLCHVDVTTYKTWLFHDGVYDKLLEL